MESMWNVMDSILGVCEIHVECHGIHGRCVWNPWDNVWNSCGDLWNRTIPPGIHLECGGRVNYWECGRTEGRHKAFIVVESWTLRVFLCDDSGLEALNGTICIVFDPEYPSRSYGFLVRRQVHDFEGASLHKSVVLKCGCFLPSICLVAMHSLFEGARFWQ